LQAGISLKGNVIHSENLKDFSKLVTGNGIANDPIEISKKFVDEIVELLRPYLNKRNGISTNDLISLFNTFPTSIQKYISAKFTEIPISSIENKIEKTTRNRNDNPRRAEEYGEGLYKSTKSDITLLKKLMGTPNVQFQMIANKLANEILQCSIDFVNSLKDPEEISIEKALELLKYANSIAVSPQVKDRIKENTNAIEELKEKELLQAVALLQSVKDAYEANKEQIMEQVRLQEMSLSYGQSTNWSKVNEIIENSLDWDKL